MAGRVARSGLGRHRRRPGRKQFAEQYVDPMVAEANRLGIDSDTLVSLMRETSLLNGGNTS
jgi:hypothetical protein